jgi:hypothetical protein
VTYRLPECLASGDDARAVRHLQTYYGTADGVAYTGSHFDSWPNNDPDRFTADDLVAVSFLSVFVSPQAALELLVVHADRFAELLSAVGPDRDLADEADPLNDDWPAARLYGAVRVLPRVGRTITTKLLARKRPRLLPIYDSVVARVTDVGDSHWEPLRTVLRAPAADGRPQLHERLIGLRSQAGLPPEISALRVYDVVTWMEGKERNIRPATAEERLGAALADGAEAPTA